MIKNRRLTALGDWPRVWSAAPLRSSAVELLARGLEAAPSCGILLFIRGMGCDEFVRDVGVGGAGALLVTTMFDGK